MALRFPNAAAFLLLHLLLVYASYSSQLTSDGLALLALKSAITDDPTRSLALWKDSDSDPCGWPGVMCLNGRVFSLQLVNLSLAGYLPSELSLLDDLQTLKLKSNRLSGPIPSALFEIRGLTSLDLSGNLLSGPIPSGIGDLEELSHLDLSDNRLNGTLPPSIAALPRLSGVLNLSCNMLSGEIPLEFGGFPASVSLDLRWNDLSGEIPQVSTLLNQGPTAFSGNPNLCGFPLKNACPSATASEEPKIPATIGGGGNFTSNPISVHPTSMGEAPPRHRRPVMAVVVLTAAALAAVAAVLLLQWQFRRRSESESEKGIPVTVAEEKSRDARGSEEEFVAVDEGFNMELDELLRASAYVVGKSRSGIVYRVVAARGSPVAVRRLSEAEEVDGVGGGGEECRRRRAFETEAMTIAKVKHPNVVSLRAYYYSPDEKLLIYDFIPNGTLHATLHAASLNSSASPLSWAVRLSIIKGIARGLAFLHECSPRKYVHGNLRTSKILLDDDLNPHISGFGITRLISGSTPAAHKQLSHSASKKLSSAMLASPGYSAYAAPESRTPGIIMTQKCDVFSFGMVLLEILTGRSPEATKTETSDPAAAAELEGLVRKAFKEERPLSEVVDPSLLHEVHAKKQVLAVFHVALACTEHDPDVRPRMRAASESLDRVGIPTR